MDINSIEHNANCGPVEIDHYQREQLACRLEKLSLILQRTVIMLRCWTVYPLLIQ